MTYKCESLRGFGNLRGRGENDAIVTEVKKTDTTEEMDAVFVPSTVRSVELG